MILYGVFEIFIFMLVGIFVIVKILIVEEIKEVLEGLILVNIYYLW